MKSLVLCGILAILSEHLANGIVQSSADFSSAGNEFVVGFGRNALAENPPISLLLYITTMETTPVSFTVSARAGATLYSGMAESNSLVEVSIPSDLEVQSDSDRDHGILVKAEGDSNITVYGLSEFEFSTDAYLALPCSGMDTDEYEYFAVTYVPFHGTYPSFILITACEDTTTVQINGSVVSSSRTIDKQETYLITNETDLTGTRITSDKPISVFTGVDCANIPTNVAACDHIFEQIPPTLNWGSTFLLASLLTRQSGEQIRIVASRSTVVSVYCNSSLSEYNLATGGEFVESFVPAGAFCSIEATAPVFVAQYASGTERDNITGDPFLMMIPPIEQYANNYAVVVLPNFASNALTLSVSPEFYQPDQIFVDGSNVSGWVDVNCPNGRLCGHIARITVAPGDHIIYHQNECASVGISIYGFNTANSYGYPGGIALSALQFIDECSMDPDACDVNAVCTNETGFYECVCNDGYRGDGFTCTDIDECLADTHSCDVNAECTNTNGSFICTCNDGYMGDGITCTDIDECLNGTHNCDVNAACTNTNGSFTCNCSDGYIGDGIMCTDINECLNDTLTCDVNATCTNTNGSFTCTCNDGYMGDGIMCVDIDKCLNGTHNCDVNAECTNTNGSFTCNCSDGYMGDGTTCTDIDECLNDTHNCDVNATCTNTDGSFICDCNIGYLGEGTMCADIDECLNGTHNCDVNAECTNINGSFTCTCNDGYMGDGTICTGVSLGGDPHFSVMLPSGKMLCFSVMGHHSFSYNLISNPRLTMNVVFTPDSKREEVTWIGALGIIASNYSVEHSTHGLTKLTFLANPPKITFDNKATLSPENIQKIVFKDGRVSISESKPRKYASVLVILDDAGLKFTIKFKREHLDIFWHSTAQQQSNSHGLIGQFFQEGVEIDEVRKILIMPNQEPVPVMRRPVWAFMEREEKDDQLCWTAMNLGYQGKGLIEGKHSDYVVSDLLADNFVFGTAV